MISKKMEGLVKGSSVIRAMFEEGKRLASIYGAENVYDFSLGNPNVAAPKSVKDSIIEILNEEELKDAHGILIGKVIISRCTNCGKIKTIKIYTEVNYEPDCFIMFGKESAGIPEEILKENPDTCVRIPMIGETRSLNLSNSVAVVLYEALRQNQFDHMKLEGELHRLSWDD